MVKMSRSIEGDPENPFLKKLVKRESGLTRLIKRFYDGKTKDHQLVVGLAESDFGYVVLLYDNEEYQRGLKISSSEDENTLNCKIEQLEFARFDVFKELNKAYAYVKSCVDRLAKQGYNVMIDLDVEGAEFETLKETVN